ncbi:MarR family transcriptional regulator [Nonomuraea rhodomycinica]|uniref:MarR family transcriptional regulator n=1 Tax=Nonomuraea rhodomycinica TaxID=1712872 RepID=A0A7Y6MGB2_9ACTN|nr:MarR family transcriptional regulator [Nonomuraea rhodomycinica]NUW45724.1 MarR family transcriptional regulator [Nonomuraea rhodomycinica]
MERMIGYWLKHLDELFENTLTATLDAGGVTRREWQVLNVLAAGDDPRAQLAPFAGVDDAHERLAGRGWAEGAELTEEGRRAHAALAEQVGRIRRRAAEGVSREEYAATIDVLRRMAANLEAA